MSKQENRAKVYANKENKVYRATRLSPQVKNRGIKNVRKPKSK